jgi:hypothetical protein
MMASYFIASFNGHNISILEVLLVQEQPSLKFNNHVHMFTIFCMARIAKGLRRCDMAPQGGHL